MPSFAELARGMTKGARDKVGRAFSAIPPQIVPGFEPRSPDRVNRDPKVVAQLEDPAALFGRLSLGAGPTPTRYGSYVGTGLEPQTIWNVLLMRNNGYPQFAVDLHEQVLERDGHLGGIYDTRRQSVADKPFRQHPAQRGSDVADTLAKLIERVIDRIDSFDQTLEDLLSATAYGYAISEIVWARDKVRFPLPNGKTGSLALVVPRSIEWVHWKHVRFDRNTDQPYLWVGSGTGEYSLPKHKFMFHAASGTGLIERRGFMGSCVWLSAAKRWAERDWLVYAKLFGIPNIMAKYPDGKEEYETHRTKYVQFLKDWGEGIPALLPDDLVVDITREPAGRSGDIHGAIVGWANGEMSKRILGSTMTVEMGGQGSWAAADTHRDAPFMRSRTDGKKLCGTIRRDLYRSFVELNAEVLAGALGAPPESLIDDTPRCSFRIEREMAPTERQKVYEGAVNELGLEVDEDQYRDEFGIDAPRQGGKALRGKPIPIGTGGLAPSVEASKDGAEAPPKPVPNAPAPKPADDEE